MTYSYIPSYLSLAEIEALLIRFPLENPVVADSFEEFLEKAPEIDLVVVHSVAVFSSLIDFLAAHQKIAVKSLSEPWLDELSNYLPRLYELATAIHTARTHRGLSRARERGKKLGRAYKTSDDPRALVARVDALCSLEGISIAEACRRLSLSPSAYHNVRRRT